MNNQDRQNKSNGIEAILMVAMVFSLFTFLSLLTREMLLGSFGEVYSNLVLGVVGFVSYGIFPIIALFSIFKLFAGKIEKGWLLFFSSVAIMLGTVLVFHIMTSSSYPVFSGRMSYASYINESYYLQASGLHGSTAGGVVASAILYYVLKNVGIMGAYILSGVVIALGAFGVIKGIFPAKSRAEKAPKKAKAKREPKAKKERREEELEEDYQESYQESNESPQFFQEDTEEKKVYNKLGMQILNPTEEQRNKYEHQFQRKEQEQEEYFEERATKMHVINIDGQESQPSVGGKRRKGKPTAKDILFNGENSVDKTIANHNMVRSLGKQRHQEEEIAQSSIPMSGNQIMDIFGTTKPRPQSVHSVQGDYEVQSTSEFFISKTPMEKEMESKRAVEENHVPTQAEIEAEKTKEMYRKEYPKVMPKIWTMADIKTSNPAEEEKAERPHLSLLEEEEEKRIQELSEREKIEMLKADIIKPAGIVDMEAYQGVFKDKPKQDTYKPRTNVKIISSVSQLGGENGNTQKTEETEESDLPIKTQENIEPKNYGYSDLNRKDFEYDVRNDEFIDIAAESALREITSRSDANSILEDTPSQEDFQDENSKISYERKDEDFYKSNFNEEKSNIGFGSLQREEEDIYSRHTISNPIFLSNADGKQGQQLPIYSDEKISFSRPYIYPPIDLLDDIEVENEVDEEGIRANAEMLESVLANFNIPAKVVATIIGPTVTKYELEMPQGIQVKRIEGYSRDISLWLKSPSEVIIEAPIPGKNRVGIEVPNKIKQVVTLKEVLSSKEFMIAKSKTVFGLGKDVAGKNILCDIKEMPHLLIAGATGMGKSVCLNTLIMSLVYHSDPSDLRMLLIDPKKVEFISYKGIPHLLIDEIISDNDKAILALQWAIDEMEKRYTLFESIRQKDIDSYNTAISSRGGTKLPRIVIVVDEVADLMSINKKEIEAKIQRLTQKARAAGIHLVLATQRPSVDVITGVIKTNLPSRIAFKLSNGIDSKTVIDEGGAERLLGRGDMFYSPCNWPGKVRVQGCYVSTTEVDRVIEFVSEQNEAFYDENCYNAIFAPNKKINDSQNGMDSDCQVDEFFKDAVRYAIQSQSITITAIQRKFGLGFPRGGKIFDAMIARGYVSETMNGKIRPILIDESGFELEFGEPF